MSDEILRIYKSTLTGIANAIRTKNPDVSGLIPTTEMEQDILDIPTKIMEELDVTENGTYVAGAGKAYGTVVVNVAGYKLKAMTPGAIASFNDGQALPLTKLLIDIEPVQAGSGDPSPSNVRPITGWTECNITVSDDETTPTVSNVYNIEFPSEAGTVYGGTLDVTNGVLTVDRVMRTFTGENDETWRVNATGGYYAFNIANLTENKVSQVPICNRFKGVEPKPYNYLNNGEVALTTSPHNYLNFLTDVATDVEGWKTWLSTNNIQIILELATPQTYQLTPTLINALLEVNNIFADTGDILEGQYFVAL